MFKNMFNIIKKIFNMFKLMFDILRAIFNMFRDVFGNVFNGDLFILLFFLY